MEKQFEAEVVAFHDDLTGWFAGTLEKTDEAFAALEELSSKLAPRQSPGTRGLRGIHGLAEAGPQYAVVAVLVEVDLAIDVDQPAGQFDQVLELCRRPQFECRKRDLQ